MGISDEIDDTTIAIHETTFLKIKTMIWSRRFFRNHPLTSRFCLVIHFVIIEGLRVSSRMSLASLYNHLCNFQSENVFQIPVTVRGKTICNIQATISLKNSQFDEKARQNRRPQVPKQRLIYSSANSSGLDG